MYDCSWMGSVHKSAGKLLYMCTKRRWSVISSMAILGQNCQQRLLSSLVRDKKRSSMLNMKGAWPQLEISQIYMIVQACNQ